VPGTDYTPTSWCHMSVIIEHNEYMLPYYTQRFQTRSWSIIFIPTLQCINRESVPVYIWEYQRCKRWMSQTFLSALPLRDIRIPRVFYVLYMILEQHCWEFEPLGTKRIIVRKASNVQHHPRNLLYLELDRFRIYWMVLRTAIQAIHSAGLITLVNIS
jgi:hypothetical protein